MTAAGGHGQAHGKEENQSSHRRRTLPAPGHLVKARAPGLEARQRPNPRAEYQAPPSHDGTHTPGGAAPCPSTQRQRVHHWLNSLIDAIDEDLTNISG